MNGATVSYFGVNQAYQLALAAQELGALDAFYCSIYDAPGKWGGILGTLLGRDALVNRRCAGFDPQAAKEIPGPFVAERLSALFLNPKGAQPWFKTSCAFDRRVASRLKESNSRIFIGVENCALESFCVAQKRGMKLVYDCPGYNARHTQASAEETARRFGLSSVSVGDTPKMERRKAAEISLADYVLCCSEVHAESLRGWGITKEKAVICPLWTDSRQWFPCPQLSVASQKLRVLYAGGITLRKGIPFLVEAARKLKSETALTLVGKASDDVRPVLEKASDWVSVRPPVAKPDLRQIYWQHDVLVLPSLGDSFGFVALEAMACGLPVVVTENCGVPVPDPAWRVPIMNSDALAQRLEYYAHDRGALQRDGQIAAAFARQYTPERYREQIKDLLKRVLS